MKKFIIAIHKDGFDEQNCIGFVKVIFKNKEQATGYMQCLKDNSKTVKFYKIIEIEEIDEIDEGYSNDI